MDFHELDKYFLDHLRRRIQSGQLTERQLARLTGISQPHVHNVLAGKRAFSPALADTILHVLRMDLLDLIPDGEIRKRLEE